MKMKIKQIIMAVVGLFFFQLTTGCEVTVKIKEMPLFNPIVFFFEFSKEEVEQAIKREFTDKNTYRLMTLEYFGKNSIRSSEAKKILTINKNDFYLHNDGFSIGQSKIYFDKHGKGLDYEVEFHIHLVSESGAMTRVEINTINPRVIVGKKLLPSFPHFGSNPIYKNVKLSTIEEYEILLKIGKGLGIKDKMPVLIEPH